MRGRVAKCTQRVQVFYRSFTDVGFHVLWFIHNDYGVGALYKFNGLFAGEFIVGLIDDVFVFGKRIYIDDQNLDGIATGKAPQVRYLFAVIHFMVYLHTVVQGLKMLKSDLKIF